VRVDFLGGTRQRNRSGWRLAAGRLGEVISPDVTEVAAHRWCPARGAESGPHRSPPRCEVSFPPRRSRARMPARRASRYPLAARRAGTHVHTVSSVREWRSRFRSTLLAVEPRCPARTPVPRRSARAVQGAGSAPWVSGTNSALPSLPTSCSLRPAVGSPPDCRPQAAETGGCRAEGRALNTINYRFGKLASCFAVGVLDMRCARARRAPQS
jgi:hypothetical protein